MTEQRQETSLSDDLRKGLEAMEQPLKAEPASEPEAPAPEPETEQAETDATETAEAEAEPAKPKLAPPQGAPETLRRKWDALDDEVKQAIIERESSVHKMFTRNDSELNLGRKMKEVISPYIPLIKSEGGTPETAVASLLNTAYVLRTAPPAQKAQLFAQLAQQYGVDLGAVAPRQDGQPQSNEQQIIRQLYQEIQELKQRANPDALFSAFEERQKYAMIDNEVAAFAASGQAPHFEQVKHVMAGLLSSGAAKDLQEAYNKACFADEQIRSTLEAERKAKEEAARKASLSAKRHAAASVTGSAGKSASSTGQANKSLHDELMANIGDYIGL